MTTPPDQVYHWMITIQGVPPFGGDETEMRYGGVVGVPAFGVSGGGSGNRGGEDVRHKPPEQHFPVHCDSSDTVAVYGSGAEDGSMGSMDMVE